jgi:ferritin-like metal-binding protein YciE
MKGLIEEGAEWMEEDAEAEVMGAGLIAAAQRVEQYKMAGYARFTILQNSWERKKQLNF